MRALRLIVPVFTVLVFFSIGWSQIKSRKTVNISSKSRLCPANTNRGDREFSGHGPDVTATARLQIVGKTKVTLRLTLYAVETKSDWTEARGAWTYTIYRAPSGHKINRILSNSYSEAKYRDTDHKLDVPRVTRGNLVRRFEINGDTGGKDIGNCTTDDVYMNVHFNPVRLEIQQLETIISRFDALSDFPRQVMNKMSKGTRGVAHDHEAWFFTQAETLWKIPVGMNLNNIGNLPPANATLVAIPPYLQRRGYHQYGDLDYYNGHLFVALEGDGRVKDRPLVAVFNATNMEIVNTLTLAHGQQAIGWIAMHPPSGHLYSSDPSTSAGVKRYKITINGDQVSVSSPSSFLLFDKNGRRLSFNNLVSGSFSADGRYLFLLNATGSNGQLWSFNLRTGREMYKTLYKGGPEPKSVSHWQIGTKAPSIRGDLHLLMLYPNAQERDAYSLKHYAVREGFDWNN